MEEIRSNAKIEPTLVIHHLSDIHIGQLHNRPNNKPPFPQSKQGSYNIDQYVYYLSNLTPNSLPDIVIISGDLTSYAYEDEFNQVVDKIDAIRNALIKKDATWRKNNSSPYVLIVPGNHDLNWNKDDYEGKIERYARTSDMLYSSGKTLSAIYYSQGQSKSPISWDFGNECNLFIYLFNTTFLGGLKDSKLDEIHKSLSKQYIDMISKRDSEEKFQDVLKSLEEQTLKDPGYISPDDLAKMKETMVNVPQHRLKIAVMHHNLSSVPSTSLESFDAITNAGIIKEFLMESGFDLVLHGHTHHAHCSHERFLLSPQYQMKGMFILGGDALGIKEDAPFLEIKIYEADKAHSNKFPACKFTASLATFQRIGYIIQPKPLIEDVIDDQIYTSVREILSKLGCSDNSFLNTHDRQHLLKNVQIIQKPLNKLESELVDWGEDSDTWVEKFHSMLDSYRRIYAVDFHSRSSLDISKFNTYIRKQYSKRLNDLKSNQSNFLSFSRPVYKAIMQTGWEPDKIMWGNYKIKEATNGSFKELEIVRILIRPQAGKDNHQKLENLDFDHKLFAIPLFVLEDQCLSPDELIDFAIGFDERGNVINCCAFNEKRGKVCEEKRKKGWYLADFFEKMLSNSSLKTVHQFLGSEPMIKDPILSNICANNYDKTRKVSTKILNLLRQNFHPDSTKVGLDIGCGTGNYTIPFINDFGKIIGLDYSTKMLDKAKEKPEADKVTWIENNALTTGLPDNSCDAVWLISTLHYFKGKRQKYLFKEIYRILKPGGVMAVDTEFIEQLASLWVVDFFPSLSDRYKDACLSKETYDKCLREIGFIDIKFEYLNIEDIENDAALRIGQREPKRYLDNEILAGIPAFCEMKPSELRQGLEKLQTAIDTGEIDTIIDEYENRATIKGVDSIIFATRPR